MTKIFALIDFYNYDILMLNVLFGLDIDCLLVCEAMR